MNWNVLIPIGVTFIINGIVILIAKLNHIPHLKELIKDNKKNIDSLWRENKEAKKERTEIIDRLSHIEGMLNGKRN